MKKISIRDLHNRTGRYVRQAMHSPLIVTERGIPMIILKKMGPLDLGGVPLPNREKWIQQLPRILTDSTEVISDDRDRL